MYDIMKENNNNLNILIEISKFKENEYIKYQNINCISLES